jgi:hypothetical protein
MEKAQALRMLGSSGHPDFPAAITQRPADAPPCQREKNPRVEDEESNDECPGKNLGHSSEVQRSLAHIACQSL